MARSNEKDGAWDFVKVGHNYQYKESWLIGNVHILEDNSDDKQYSFLIRVDEANGEPPQDGQYVISSPKKSHFPGVWNEMIQFYEKSEYTCEYKYKRKVPA